MKNVMKEKRMKALRRAKRVRARVRGTAECPRLTIKRSAKHIYAQLINDEIGKTLAAASDMKMKKAGKPLEVATAVGTELGEKAKAAGVKRAVVDRGSYRYHGRVKALAEALAASGVTI
ncbi:MAG: 50S ribosomal protein L18 [Patescibacteria group bacterium]